MNLFKSILAVCAGVLLLAVLFLLGIAFALNRTVCRPEFALVEIDRADAVGAGRELVLQRMPARARPYAPAVGATYDELRPWIRGQVRAGTPLLYDYLFERTDRLVFTVSSEPVRRSLREHLLRQILEQPPADFAQVPPAELPRIAEEAADKMIANLKIRPEYQFDSATTRLKWQEMLERAQTLVHRGRQATRVLIGLGIVLAAAIVLLRGSLFGLSVVFIVSGVAGYAGYLMAVSDIRLPVAAAALPEGLRAYAPLFFRHVLDPLASFNLWVLACGAVLLIVSWLLHRGRAKPGADGAR